MFAHVREIALTAESFRRAFLAGEGAPGEPEEDVPSRLTRAAVLVPVADRAEGLSLLLTRRTDHLRRFATDRSPAVIELPATAIDEAVEHHTGTPFFGEYKSPIGDALRLSE